MSGHEVPSPAAAGQPEHVVDTVSQVRQLDQEDHVTMSWADHLAEAVATHVGSMQVLAVHAVAFSIWIALNLPIRFAPRFDPFPFSALSLAVALEAIFLSMVVLMAQNRQARRYDRRAKVEFQLNMVAEREITKVLSMLSEVQASLGIRPEPDSEASEMTTPTRVDQLLDAADARDGQSAGAGSQRPDKSKR